MSAKTNTTTDLTPADRAELRRLCEKATPGPWEFRAGNDPQGDSVDLLMAEIGKAAGDEDPEYAEVLFGLELSASEISANWELIAAARTALPALLDQVEELEAENKRLRDVLEEIVITFEGSKEIRKMAKAALKGADRAD